ncbi:uncharacterized protein Bfra_002835 [Botrytis fragariae]|uniref:Uncharacterized protein n=1 Tax=Botrytis fragariae TaxID=1964551 RepID=A0A8H6AZ30_9HELO|nr:uncharacterized protein Bfra_002835 [Botrytis fragariae]KAF5876431.1 hypothetical protein Bfra_002835 [Botrytis fragariae]
MATQLGQIYETLYTLIGPFIPFLVPINFYINLRFLCHPKWKTSTASKFVNAANMIQLLSRSVPRVLLTLWSMNGEFLGQWRVLTETGLIILALLIWGSEWDIDEGSIDEMLDDWWATSDDGNEQRKMKEQGEKDSDKGGITVECQGHQSKAR